MQLKRDTRKHKEYTEEAIRRREKMTVNRMRKSGYRVSASEDWFCFVADGLGLRY